MPQLHTPPGRSWRKLTSPSTGLSSEIQRRAPVVGSVTRLRIRSTLASIRAPSIPRIGASGSVASTESVSRVRSEEHTSELQSLMRISYAVFCLKKKNKQQRPIYNNMYDYTRSNKKPH